MAAGDGVSLPTTLAQMGSVAKTQAKSQANATHTAPMPDRVQDDEDMKVNRVKEADEANQDKVDPDKGQEKDKRQRRRLKRNRKLLAQDEEDAAKDGENEDGEAETLGVLIDMRV